MYCLQEQLDKMEERLFTTRWGDHDLGLKFKKKSNIRDWLPDLPTIPSFGQLYRSFPYGDEKL